MELIATLNQYSGGLLVLLIVSATGGWLSQRRRLDRVETLLTETLKRWDHPVIGVVPRVEFENHRDEARKRLNTLEQASVSRFR